MHSRLGHASLSKMTRLVDLSDINMNKFVCDSYHMAKFHRMPFPVSDSRAKTPFELIHADLWGPYKTADTSGALTTLDDHTRLTWVYLLQIRCRFHGSYKISYYMFKINFLVM